MNPGLPEIARHLIEPDGIASTAWPRVRDTCARLGWGFDQWQDDLGMRILAKRRDGSYASDAVVVSIPRQCGKTYTLGAMVFALSLIHEDLTTIWTAHRAKTAKETFDAMKAMAGRPEVAPLVEQVIRARGDEGVHFTNSSRILFGAREHGFGLGFAGVDVLVLDEAQRVTDRAMDDLVPTTNAAPNPLILLTGTPPRPTDPGEVFTMLREEAISGDANDTLYVELSADRDADPDDRAQWRIANPSYPHRTSERAILRMQKMLGADSFRREGMGIWDETPKHLPVVRSSEWAELIDAGPPDETPPDALAVDMSHDREISTSASWVEDDRAFGEEVWAGRDVDQAVEWLVAHAGRRIPVVIDSMSPAASLIPVLKRRGVRVVTGTASDMSRACGLVFDEIRSGRIGHANQERLNDAVKGARRRKIGTAGGWGWDRTDATVNIAPLVSWTLARFGAEITQRRRSADKPKVVVL